MSEITKAKISLAKAKQPSGFLGKHHTQKTKNVFSKRLSGKHASDETRRKISENNARPMEGRKKKNASSRYYGVYLDKTYAMWRPFVRIDRKDRRLRYCKTEVAAAKAYDAFVAENGLNKPLNFPRDYPEHKYLPKTL